MNWLTDLRNNFNNKWLWLGAGLAVIYIRGLFIPVMDVDASQYASISMEMLQDGSWLEVHHRHNDYLDKPPLLFWLSALSYSIFGISTWAYKLPSLLGAFVGIYAIFRFTKLYYSFETARAAAFILASCVGVFLLGNDIRTDTLLLGMTAGAVWNLAEYHERHKWIHLVGTGIFIGLAMLAKGPIGLILPVAAIGSHLLLSRDWKGIFRWQWLVAFVVAGILLIPMCVGLYHQFDLHPEKTINDRTGVSGIYFYFWEQSFGRITGENVWKNDTTVLNFLHVYLWAFLPWTLLLIGGLTHRIRTFFAQKWRIPAGEEAFSVGAFVLIFIALSLSKYKLPHYIFITLPWAAVLTARWLYQAENKPRWIAKANFGFLLLAGLVALLIPGFVFPTWNPAIWIPALVLLIFAGRNTLPRYFFSEGYIQGTIAVGILIGFVLNFCYYTYLMPYQSTVEAGKYFFDHQIPVAKRAQLGATGHALDFYSQSIVAHLQNTDTLQTLARKEGQIWVYVREGGREQLDDAGIPYTIEAQFQHFQVALMKTAFLNPATRNSVLNPVEIVRIDAKNLTKQ